MSKRNKRLFKLNPSNARKQNCLSSYIPLYPVTSRTTLNSEYTIESKAVPSVIIWMQDNDIISHLPLITAKHVFAWSNVKANDHMTTQSSNLDETNAFPPISLLVEQLCHKKQYYMYMDTILQWISRQSRNDCIFVLDSYKIM